MVARPWHDTASEIARAARMGPQHIGESVPGKFSPTEAETRRNEILDAAAAVFAAQGYERSTIADLERATGLTRGGLFFHYDSKRHIYLEVLRRMLLNQGPAVERAALDSDGAYEAMLRAHRRYLDWHEERPERRELLDQLHAGLGRDADLDEFYTQAMNELYAFYATVCRELQLTGRMNADLDPEAAARVIGSVFNGLQDFAREHSDRETEAQIELAFRTLAVGLSAEADR